MVGTTFSYLIWGKKGILYWKKVKETNQKGEEKDIKVREKKNKQGAKKVVRKKEKARKKTLTDDAGIRVSEIQAHMLNAHFPSTQM